MYYTNYLIIQSDFYSFVRSFFSLHIIFYLACGCPIQESFGICSIQLFAHTNLSHLSFESVLNIEYGSAMPRRIYKFFMQQQQYQQHIQWTFTVMWALCSLASFYSVSFFRYCKQILRPTVSFGYRFMSYVWTGIYVAKCGFSSLLKLDFHANFSNNTRTQTKSRNDLWVKNSEKSQQRI